MVGEAQETGDQIKSAALHALADNKPADVERTGSSSVDNLRGPLVLKKARTENVEAPAPAVKELICADEEGQIDKLSPDVEVTAKTNAAEGSEEIGEDYFALKSWYHPVCYYVGKLPDLMRDKIHNLKTDPCHGDADGQCNCEGRIGFQCDVFELLAVRVKLSVDDGQAPSGQVALREAYTHLIYDETEAAPGQTAGPILEGYDPSFLLLEGPNVPVQGVEGVHIIASIPPLPAHALELATVTTLFNTKGWPVCMFGKHLDVSYIFMENPILARVEVITHPHESKLKDGKTKVFGIIKARNGLCGGKAVVVEKDLSEVDPFAYTFPTDGSMMLKLCPTSGVETRKKLLEDSSMLDQLLFRKNKNEAVDSFYPGKRIKLSRYVLSLEKGLTLKVQLYGIGDEPNSYYEIAKGEERFQVKCGGVTEKIIRGESGSVVVKVAWNIDLQPKYEDNGVTWNMGIW